MHSDFTEYYQGYKLHLNTVPIYKKHDNQWWLNKMFSKDFDNCCLNSAIYYDPSNDLTGHCLSDGWSNGIRIDDTIPEGDTLVWIHLVYVFHI